ncbi:Uncharacterized protein Adt_37077 [Abeliophyllum distichum]|uniref:Uncharacterized protein n=1 Tax=Abeliophyllum distichum TaxID=126358 RepID=A0ABD1QJU8_9LAMI
MASWAASMAASRVLNLRNSSLRSLIHRHLLRPDAATASTTHIINTKITPPEQQLFNHFYSGKLNPDLVNPSFDTRNLNTNAANLPQNLQYALGFSARKIEAARRRDDDSDSDCDDDKDIDYNDLIPDYDESGSCSDDDDDDDQDDEEEDEDEAPPRRFRK